MKWDNVLYFQPINLGLTLLPSSYLNWGTAMSVDCSALLEDFLNRIEAARRDYEKADDDHARLMSGYRALQTVNRLILMAGGEPALIRPLGFVGTAIFNASRGA